MKVQANSFVQSCLPISVLKVKYQSYFDITKITPFSELIFFSDCCLVIILPTGLIKKGIDIQEVYNFRMM